MKNTLLTGLLVLAAALPAGLHARDTLCTPDPSPEAVALYRYLNDLKGNKIISGQMWAPWGVDELIYIQNKTGKQPALRGIDFIHQEDNAMEVQNAISWWNKGGIPSIMWHWGAPGVGEGYPNSKEEIDIDRCFQEGTPEYTDFWSELESKADLLETLRDENIPILWRPYHEFDGHWFWWSKGGPEQFKKLWVTMFDYFVHDRKLNNLIWVLCHTGSPDADWYPGDEYVDIGAADQYNVGDSPRTGMYNKVKEITRDQFPIAYHECGVIPHPEKCIGEGSIWSWWMVWHTGHLTGHSDSYLNYVYDHDLIITLDEVPDIMAVYGGQQDTCPASDLRTEISVDGGEWQDTSSVIVDVAARVSFRASATDAGIFQWDGYGTTGSDSLQEVPFDGTGVATVTFDNHCGTRTTQSFYVIRVCTQTEVIPYLRVDSGDWQKAREITINEGSTITLSPRPETGGSWEWKGGITSAEREITLTPEESFMSTVVYTNDCGSTSFRIYVVTVLPNTTGISNRSKVLTSLSPVPCTSWLRLTMNREPAASPRQISIYDLLGTELYTRYSPDTEVYLNTAGLAPDVYLLKIIHEDGVSAARFVKQ